MATKRHYLPRVKADVPRDPNNTYFKPVKRSIRYTNKTQVTHFKSWHPPRPYKIKHTDMSEHFEYGKRHELERSEYGDSPPNEITVSETTFPTVNSVFKLIIVILLIFNLVAYLNNPNYTPISSMRLLEFLKGAPNIDLPLYIPTDSIEGWPSFLQPFAVSFINMINFSTGVVGLIVNTLVFIFWLLGGMFAL